MSAKKICFLNSSCLEFVFLSTVEDEKFGGVVIRVVVRLERMYRKYIDILFSLLLSFGCMFGDGVTMGRWVLLDGKETIVFFGGEPSTRFVVVYVCEDKTLCFIFYLGSLFFFFCCCRSDFLHTTKCWLIFLS